ncbi:MAG: hypothetical protein R6V23_07990 [Bacteroidales bacterium]
MRNFIILFHEKEGTSPLVRLLNNFKHISIIHQENNKGFEPFNFHQCGPMRLPDLKYCIETIYNEDRDFEEKLNKVYTKTAKSPFESFSKNSSVGFKMRFKPPVKNFLGFLYKYIPFEKMMMKVLKKNKVIVFLAVRQDIFRWGLSKYHGDGTGKKGHIQFKLASGKVSKEDINKIHVNPFKFKRILKTCEFLHARKRALMKKFQKNGIEVFPLIYEDFLADKQSLLEWINEALDLPASREEITSVIQEGEYFQKVHSNDISEFVTNHEEIIRKFGDRCIPWR